MDDILLAGLLGIGGTVAGAVVTSVSSGFAGVAQHVRDSRQRERDERKEILTEAGLCLTRLRGSGLLLLLDASMKARGNPMADAIDIDEASTSFNAEFMNLELYLVRAVAVGLHDAAIKLDSIVVELRGFIAGVMSLQTSRISSQDPTEADERLRLTMENAANTAVTIAGMIHRR